MMIKLNPKNKTCFHFEPPFEITRHFDDVDTDAPANEQIEQLLWIPAVLVSRFHGQFPTLYSELDELFSVGMLTVCEIVNERKHSASKLGGVIHVSCVRAMEDYCNSLNSVVKVGTTTRYLNHQRGIETPSHQRMSSEHATYDDQTELHIRDACEALGVELSGLNTKQKRKLYEALN